MTQQTWHARLPFYYGWVIVGAVFLTGIPAAGVVWAASVIAVPMADHLGWSRSAVFAGITVRSISMAAGALVLGSFLDRRNGARYLLAASSVVSTGALFAVVLVRQPWQFLLVFGVFSGFLGAAQGPLLSFAIVPKWFVRRRGQATAMASMGTGFAALILPPIMAFANGSYGWQGSWVVLACIVFMATSIPATLIRRQPEDVGLRPLGSGTGSLSGRPVPVEVESVRPKAALRAPATWLLILAIAAGSLSTIGFPAGLVSFYVDRHFSEGVAALGLSLYGISSLGSRFLWGYLVDRFHIRTVVMAISAYGFVAMLGFLFLPRAAVLLYGPLVGFGMGGFVGVSHLVWAAYFGRRYLGAINGLTRPFAQTAAAFGPLVMAQSFDRTGSYAGGLYAFAVSWLLCFALMSVVRPRHPSPVQGAAQSQ